MGRVVAAAEVVRVELTSVEPEVLVAGVRLAYTRSVSQGGDCENSGDSDVQRPS